MSNFMKNIKELKSDSHPPKELSVIALQKSWKMLSYHRKALFVLKIIKFFSWFFYHVQKTVWWQK